MQQQPRAHRPTRLVDVERTVDAYLTAWTEIDPARRHALIDEVWSVDGRLDDPPRAASGRSGFSKLSAILLVEFPGYSFRRVGGVLQDGDRVCILWEFVGPDDRAAIGGIDIGDLAADGRLRRIARHYHVPRTGHETGRNNDGRATDTRRLPQRPRRTRHAS